MDQSVNGRWLANAEPDETHWDDSGARARSRGGQNVLRELLTASIIRPTDWEALPRQSREAVQGMAEVKGLLEQLEQLDLLTAYQVARIRAGKRFGLMLGNYRVLQRLGAGGMGVVYKCEHRHLRRPVAIKVLPLASDEDEQLLPRFYAEMRAVAQLQHPNIVSAIDAGEMRSPDPDSPVLHYFVMEYVQGQDLEAYVNQHGPLPPTQACDLIFQAASALAEAHKHQLIHRDIKPSNILVTPEGQAKLLDFGLARQFGNRLTEPGTVLGTIDYLAPEQARDSSNVDIRADIYGLGGTLFWSLTGQQPFPVLPSITRELAARLGQAPPAVRSRRPDLSPELEAVIKRMMALNPDDRYPTPQAVMRALLRFVQPQQQAAQLPADWAAGFPPAAAGPRTDLDSSANRVGRVLIIDDEASLHLLCMSALQSASIHCEAVSDGAAGLALLAGKPFDLVLVDMHMPGLGGLEIVRALRANPPVPNLKIVVFSGHVASDTMAELLLAGADDFLTKPFSLVQFQARIKAALNHKHAQDRSDLLNHHLMGVNGQLEQALSARDSDLVHTRNALVMALAQLVEHCDTETGAHLHRIQRYVRILAEEAAALPAFTGRVDADFTQLVECCAPLHDIGKIALPDHILMKPGKLAPDERILMQQHTIIGAETLQAVARQHGAAVIFLQTAIDICRHHHERFDGAGYPDRLAGEAIPLAARLVALADVYDALRSRRIYKPALSHMASMQIILEGSPGQFDPALLPALERCAPRWERTFAEIVD